MTLKENVFAIALFDCLLLTSAYVLLEGRSDSTLVEAVVQDVDGKLNCLSSFYDFKGLVGIGRQLGKVESLLNISSLEVRIVGINWGIVSIDGKIILDLDLFHRLASHFEAGFFFLENTKEEIKRNGLRYLQKASFSGILGKESSTLEFAKNRLLRTKSHVVINDVDEGSENVITTRSDAQVLNSIAAHGVNSSNFQELHKIVCSKDSQGSASLDDYALLPRKVVECSRVLPSAVKDLGTRLGSKTKKACASVGSRVWRPFRKGKKGRQQLEAAAEGVGFDDSNNAELDDDLTESSEMAGSGEKGDSGGGINLKTLSNISDVEHHTNREMSPSIRSHVVGPISISE
ncbi:hypothetical protein TIFTF001_035263 [Ficus carica]|uniref:Uncharacterized protein n=1 Tax=Ficus carica TaxID=3494 RepID=A0AA88E593_FICCA|nr:hypothetical protein TIFTF001_035263 [Ficus carica]